MAKAIPERVRRRLRNNGRGGPQVRIAAATYIDHPDGVLRLWAGQGKIEYGGETWDGIGQLGAIDGLERVMESYLQEVTLRLSGVSSDMAELVNDDVNGRSAYVYRWYLSEALEVLHAETIAEIVLDRATYQLDENLGGVYSLIGHCGLWFIQGGNGATLSKQDQERRFPGDTGFDFVTEQASKSLDWGY